MTTRRELEALMKLLMKKAKAKYGSLEMISWKTGISTKSLHRYEIGEVLPSLEVYAILCECVGGRCYSDKSGSDLLFCRNSIDRTGLSDLLKKVENGGTMYVKRGAGTVIKFLRRAKYRIYAKNKYNSIKNTYKSPVNRQ